VKRYRVASSQIEDIHTGAMFAPGETAVGIDPDDPYDAAKIVEGKFVELAEQTSPWASPEAEAKATELDISVDDIQGTGKNGGITVADVELAHDNQEVSK
jgi:pyruvate dehydrogenase E2 component (dihydrolipoamide acetyltransferase)